MYHLNYNQYPQAVDEIQVTTALPLPIVLPADDELSTLITKLSPETSWGKRQEAARKLGYKKNPAAVPALLDALPADPYWMVRNAIIQALQQIGDPRAIPTLHQVAENDGMQVVRSYAAKAIERLSHLN